MRFTAFLVFLAFVAFALWARWYYVCEVRDLCHEAPTDLRQTTLQLTEDGRVILDGYDEFAYDSTSVYPRLNANNQSFLDTLAYLLHQDSTKNLKIVGFYRESESGMQSGFYEDLGTARAAGLRRLLERRDVGSDRFSLDQGLTMDEELAKPLLFELYDSSEYAQVEYSFNNMTFSDANFAFDSDEFRPTEAAVLYADSVKTHFELNPNQMLTIVGHTDSKGSSDYNYELGLRRSESAKQYFEELGVQALIEVGSQGEKAPKAPNMLNGKDNPEGRQKNRRVQFIISEMEIPDSADF